MDRIDLYNRLSANAIIKYATPYVRTEEDILYNNDYKNFKNSFWGKLASEGITVTLLETANTELLLAKTETESGILSSSFETIIPIKYAYIDIIDLDFRTSIAICHHNHNPHKDLFVLPSGTLIISDADFSIGETHMPFEFAPIDSACLVKDLAYSLQKGPQEIIDSIFIKKQSPITPDIKKLIASAEDCEIDIVFDYSEQSKYSLSNAVDYAVWRSKVHGQSFFVEILLPTDFLKDIPALIKEYGPQHKNFPYFFDEEVFNEYNIRTYDG